MCVLTSLDEKKEKSMYPSPQEIKDQEIESNKCNYPKSLIFCEFCCSLFETQFFYTSSVWHPAPLKIRLLSLTPLRRREMLAVNEEQPF